MREADGYKKNYFMEQAHNNVHTPSATIMNDDMISTDKKKYGNEFVCIKLQKKPRPKKQK